MLWPLTPRRPGAAVPRPRRAPVLGGSNVKLPTSTKTTASDRPPSVLALHAAPIRRRRAPPQECPRPRGQQRQILHDHENHRPRDAGLGLAVKPAIEISVGLFAEERRQQTLELLYLTGMRSAELFIGKLLGGAIVASSELMALAPLMAVPFLSGGLSFDLFLATETCLPTVFVATLALGSFCSALCRQEVTALICSGVLIGSLCLALPLPYGLGLWLTGQAPFDKSWLLFSPALGPWLVVNGFGTFGVANFWLWTAIMWTLASGSLALAALALKRNWRKDVERSDPHGWAARWERLVHGNSAWREALRRRLLDINAYQWLAQQDRRPALQAWAFLSTICVLWLLGWCAWPRFWPAPLNLYATAFLLLAGVDLLVSHAAAWRMAQDRRDGALELLLTSPLTPTEILDGHKAALDEQLKPLKLILSGLLALLALAGCFAHGWTKEGVVSYLAVWFIFFLWCWRTARRSAPMTLWVAANPGRPLYSTIRTLRGSRSNWGVYWLVLMSNSFLGFSGRARSFPNGSTLEMVVVLCAVVWVLVFTLASQRSSDAASRLFAAELRFIAQQPLPEHTDPRFKEWPDLLKPFPFSDTTGKVDEQKHQVKAAGAWLWRPLGRMGGRAWANLQKRSHPARQRNHRTPTDLGGDNSPRP